MIIKQIKIENFGKHSKLDLKLNSGVNTIAQDNGWGKSTLTAFIKVMFFGFDGEAKKSKLEREREYYRPWQGGTYGGSIVFETNGKEYKMSRTFGLKAAEDVFELCDNKTNLASNDFTSNIGEELLNLDAESFKRTVLISQNDVKTGATDKINANLGNLAGTTDDIDNYEAVCQKFKEKLNALSSTRTTGQIYRLKNEISQYQSEVRSIAGVESNCREKEKAIDTLKAQLDFIKAKAGEYEAELGEVSRAAELLSKKEQYEGICKRFDERKRAYEETEAFFAKGIPSGDDIAENLEKLSDIREAELKAAQSKLSADEEANLSSESAYFASHVPSSDEISGYSDRANEVYKKEKEFASLQFSEEEKADYERLSEKFEGMAQVEEKTAELSNALMKSNSVKAAIPGNEALLFSLNVPKKEKDSPLWLILLISGLVLLLCGAALFFVVSKIVGGVLSGVGLVLIVAGILAKFTKKAKPVQNAGASEYDKLKEKLESDKQLVETTENSVGDFLSGFGIVFDPFTAFNDLSDIKNEYGRYKSLVAKESDKRDDELLAEISEEKKAIESFIAPFDGLITREGGFVTKLQQIVYKASEYSKLRSKKDAYDDAQKEVAAKKQKVSAYVTELGFDGEREDIRAELGEIKEKLAQYKRSKVEYQAVKLEKETFETSNNAAEIAAATAPADGRSAADVQEQLRAALDEREKINDRIGEQSTILTADYELLDELRAKESELSDKMDEYERLLKREKLISKTRDILDRAKQNFVGKYSSGVTQGFKKYYELLDGSDGNEYSFDANMNLKIEDHGTSKELQSYSFGSRDKVGICFRLGLIEAMYSSEKPVLIMDDPFTNLDAKRIAGAQKLMDALKDDYQIIYFTCHESRIPNV